MPISTGILALIKDRDATNAIPEKDLMCYKRGDFVELWGPGTSYTVPCAEPFYLLDVTGVAMSVEEIKARYQQSVMDTTDPEHPKAVRRRLYWVDLNTIPNPNKNDLAANRVTVIAWNRLRSSVKNKVTGQPEG
jgi:hypothetical protein